MRALVLSLTLVAALGLGGCSGGSDTSSNQAPAQTGSSAGQQIPSSVSGTVALTQPHELSDQAVMTIKLVDVSASNSKPLATRSVSPITSLPVSFSFQVKPDQVNSSDIYAVQAQITDGERHFTMAVPAPVLTRGASGQADIKLKAIATPGEKVMAAYKKAKAQIGGMLMSKGTSLSKTSSEGWQVFRDRDSGKIAYVIGLIQHFDKDFIQTDYAYKDGQPWVVIQQHKPSEKAKTSAVDRASWNAQGELVLKQHVANGKTSTLSADKAASLKKQAQAMFKKAKKTKKAK